MDIIDALGLEELGQELSRLKDKAENDPKFDKNNPPYILLKYPTGRLSLIKPDMTAQPNLYSIYNLQGYRATTAEQQAIEKFGQFSDAYYSEYNKEMVMAKLNGTLSGHIPFPEDPLQLAKQVLQTQTREVVLKGPMPLAEKISGLSGGMTLFSRPKEIKTPETVLQAENENKLKNPK